MRLERSMSRSSTLLLANAALFGLDYAPEPPLKMQMSESHPVFLWDESPKRESYSRRLARRLGRGRK